MVHLFIVDKSWNLAIFRTMQQMKQALLKAGLISKDTAKNTTKGKKPASSKVPKKEFKKFNENQIKTICELCDQYAPDVEYYKHNNRLIVKRWLCIKCADEHRIDDNLRETHQSSDARARRFHRMWGRTKKS